MRGRARRGQVGRNGIGDPLRALGAGTTAIRARLGRRTGSDHYTGRRFTNPEPDAPMTWSAVTDLVRRWATRRPGGRPPRPIPVVPVESAYAPAPCAVTWLGHASVLFEVDGLRILADPITSSRASPTTTIGPRRLHPTPATVPQLAPLDAVLISHDHYDHLDRPTVRALVASTAAPFLVPLGIGAHLTYWGVPSTRIVELDWGEAHRIGPTTVVCTPARHFSGRGLVRNTTLWASWTIVGPTRRVFFGGDTGYSTLFTEIGDRYGPFDLTALPIGAYDAAWPDIHMTPEQAARAHLDLRGEVLLPIHWATFDLAPHHWSAPIDRLLRETGEVGVITPVPGARVTVAGPVRAQRWW